MQEKCFHQKNAFFHMLSCDNMCFHMYHVLSRLIMSYHVLSCLITSYHVLSRLIMSYHAFHMLSCDNMCFLSFLAAQPPAFDFFGLPFFWLSSHHMLIFLLAVQPSHVDFFLLAVQPSHVDFFWLSSHHMLFFFCGCPAPTTQQPVGRFHPKKNKEKQPDSGMQLLQINLGALSLKKSYPIQGCSSYRLSWGPCPLKNPSPFRDAAPID